MITKIIMNNVASYKTSTSLETDKKLTYYMDWMGLERVHFQTFYTIDQRISL